MIAEVIVDVLNSEVDKVFDYIIPNNFSVKLGCRVKVPFGNRLIDGYILNIKDTSNYDNAKLKSIELVIDEKPVIIDELLKLMFYMKENYHLRFVDVIRLIVPTQVRSGKVKGVTTKMLRLAEDGIVNDYISKLPKNSKNAVLIINKLKTVGEDSFSNLSKEFSNATVNKMLNSGVLLENLLKVDRKIKSIEYKNKDIVLTNMQQKVVNAVTELPDLYLLHGVTGSGKTEVYLHIISEMLCKNKNAIMLVPEISLTPQMVGIFKSRFGNKIAVIHSKLSDGERFDEWHRIINGEAKIVVGARSAIFAPLENLGVIIIDEEHDGSYYSESNPRYFTHEIAEFRAKYNNCSLVLGSATPSLESYYNAKIGKYKLLELPVRVNNKEMPTIEIVDMTTEFRSGNNGPFSYNLLSKLQATINANNQAILFINRRGYSSFLMCNECGYIPRCTSCDVTLVYHRQENELKCHYCGKRFKVLTRCVKCKSENIKLGGVGTERVVSELKNLFPNVAMFRMDNDTTKNKNAHANIITEFSKTRPAILVGTQMVSKGHDFSEVDLVGILNADLSLFFNDYKANEKTFQLITQVSGRAGRSEIEGRVVLQTFFPKHFVYKLVANYDYKKFYDKEINLRQTTMFPPFSKILRILITSINDDLAKDYTHKLFLKLKELRISLKEDFYLLEAMKSPLTKIKDKYRYQVVTKFNTEKQKEIIDKIYSIIDDNKVKNIQVFVETNPQSLA